MNHMPELNQANEQLWLELLADNELNRLQREQLYSYLDGDDQAEDDLDNAWKRCALTLLHERNLVQEISAVYAESKKSASPSKQTGAVAHRSNWLTAALAAGLAFVLGGFAHYFWQQSTEQGTTVVVESSEPESRETEMNSLASDDKRGSASGLKSHTIYEIEDTPTRATYYLSHQMPELMLQALVLAGHAVEVEQDSINTFAMNGERVSIPVTTLHVEKFAQSRF